MASIGGLTSSTSSSLTGTNSLKGYGGLASGLDRDSLIEAMTSGTQSKIQKQKQQKQIVEWQQEAIRNITDKMYDFSQKYLSYTSSTNLLSSSFFSRNNITSEGVNGKYVSVSGNSPLIDDISILGVKQLAKNAQKTSTKVVSGNETSVEGEGSIDINGTINTSKLAGKSFTFKIGVDGAQEFTVNIPSDADFNLYGTSVQGEDSLDTALRIINEALEEDDQRFGEKKLSELIEFKKVTIETEEGKHVQRVQVVNKSGNTMTFVSGDEVFQALGILGENETLSEKEFDTSGVLTGTNEAKVVDDPSKLSVLRDTTLTFSYNGETKSIKVKGEAADPNKGYTLEDYKQELQNALDEAYGKGRIEINEAAFTNNKLKFDLKIPNQGDDTTSVLSIVGSSIGGVLGENGILGIEEGATNRLNTQKKLGDLTELNLAFTNGEGSMVINGETISFTQNTTLQELMDKIKEKTGLTINYLSTTDRATITASEQGAGSVIYIKGTDDNAKNFMKYFHFIDDGAPVDNSGNIIVEKGQDAIMTVKYKDSNQIVDITRGSNSFKMDGLEFSLTGEFGVYNDTVDPDTGSMINEVASKDGAVTFDAKANVEDTTKAVKEMIDAFNEILSLVNTTVNEKQSASDKYEPLTDQQKEEMTESQITAWEKKAKVGILYNDTELRGLASALRFVLPSGADRQALADIGISVSTDYADNGKLVFDETKFKRAMETDPDKVRQLFTGITSSGSEKTDSLMNNIQNVMDQYAKTTGATKGILIQRAGSTKAPLSVIQNSMQKQIENIQKVIEQLQDRLESEQSRYISQFTRLETVISNMNAQSSWLSQLQ